MYIIIRDKCSVCGLCADVCPVEAISQIGEYKIVQDICTGCGLCCQSCPSEAIIQCDFKDIS
ncbi:MAG: 4Fe-4S binding protein [Syntrophomonadaceae bacterium]|nr:4Fe-4S binding protein [Syntrophomonadaceae bacterium]